MSNTLSSRVQYEWCHFKTGLAGPLDSYISKFLGDLRDRDVPLGLDLSQIKFIEPATMLVILAIYSDLKRNDRPPIIKFPTDYHVRRIMATWKFLDALKIVGHPTIPMANVLDTIGDRLQDDLEKDLEKSYLPIRIICGTNSEDRPGNQHVDDELERSNETKLMAWLQSHLICPESIDQTERRNFVKETFPSRIVFEAMMNSVRHPEATRIVTTSHINWNREKNEEEASFTCIWWDDGKGIIETLKSAIKDGRSIVSSASPLPEKQCSLKIDAGEEVSPTYESLTTNFVPNGDSTDAQILFSSICSRITRDPEGIGHRTKLPKDVPEDSPLRQPGMGLYILVDCAVNIFKGSVSFRTGNLFMNVKRGSMRGPRKADYKISISCPSDTYHFPGNMLIVRLPILKQPKSEKT